MLDRRSPAYSCMIGRTQMRKVDNKIDMKFFGGESFFVEATPFIRTQRARGDYSFLVMLGASSGVCSWLPTAAPGDE